MCLSVNHDIAKKNAILSHDLAKIRQKHLQGQILNGACGSVSTKILQRAIVFHIATQT